MIYKHSQFPQVGQVRQIWYLACEVAQRQISATKFCAHGKRNCVMDLEDYGSGDHDKTQDSHIFSLQIIWYTTKS